MKEEKGKLILIYILMLVTIALIIALTFMVLDNIQKENHTSHATETPTVDVNPYPNISDECTFDLTKDEYNALEGPLCKNGYSRYNIKDISLNGNNINVTIIYTDLEGSKTGLYINDKKSAALENVTNLKFGIFSEQLFILNTSNNESNVLVYNESTKIYDLKETLEENEITDPILNQIITSKTLNSESFVFTNEYFTFNTQIVDELNQTQAGSSYIVTYANGEFANPQIKG